MADDGFAEYLMDEHRAGLDGDLDDRDMTWSGDGWA